MFGIVVVSPEIKQAYSLARYTIIHFGIKKKVSWNASNITDILLTSWRLKHSFTIYSFYCGNLPKEVDIIEHVLGE